MTFITYFPINDQQNESTFRNHHTIMTINITVISLKLIDFQDELTFSLCYFFKYLFIDVVIKIVTFPESNDHISYI